MCDQAEKRSKANNLIYRERKQELDQESDQVKKKVFPFFLGRVFVFFSSCFVDHFLGEVPVFLCSYFPVFFFINSHHS